MLVEAVDSPTYDAQAFTPNGGSGLLSMWMSMNFVAYLTVWSNVTGSNSSTPVSYGSAGAFADHVCGVVLTQPWTVSANIVGNLGINNPVLAAGAATMYQTAQPIGNVSNPGVALTAPTAISLLVYNAEN